MTTISKEFNWEMSHRLTFHDGACKNIHGHSYKMHVVLKGELDSQGMIIDFYDLAKIVDPLLEKLDHAFLCNKEDMKMIDFLKENNFKYFVMNEFTTCENMCDMFLKEFEPQFREFNNIKEIGIRVYETVDAYAEKWETIN